MKAKSHFIRQLSSTDQQFRRGVGSDLLGRLLGSAASVYRAVCPSVSADNPAVRLYVRAGFERVCECGDSLTMVRRLGA